MRKNSLQSVYLNVQQSEVRLVTMLAQKMGWEITTRADFLQKRAKSRPKNVDLQDKKVADEDRDAREVADEDRDARYET